jgi:hypothetical protein
MNNWKLIHTYNILVADGKAKALLCPDSQDKLIVIIDPLVDLNVNEPVPALRCFGCDTILRPGLDLWQQIRAVVAEHYTETV